MCHIALRRTKEVRELSFSLCLCFKCFFVIHLCVNHIFICLIQEMTHVLLKMLWFITSSSSSSGRT